MDCDKFERVLMSYLYGELDQLTRAGSSRHADQCRRCQQLLVRFKTTREVGALPLEEPLENFELRVLEAERQVHLGLPWARKLSRGLTIVGGYAMRPQLAMAALALLMIGSSLLFLRPHPRSAGTSRQVIPEGAPRAEPEEFVVPIEQPEVAAAASAALAPAEPVTPEPAPSAKRPAAVATAASSLAGSEEELDLARARAEDRAYAGAMAAFRAADHALAQQQFDAIVEAGGRNAAAAELYAALASEQAQGCSAALPRFDSVAAKYGSATLGHMATWNSAICRTKLGHDRRALLDFQKLLRVPAYAERARKSLGLVGTEGAADVLNDSPAAASVAAATSAAVAPEVSPSEGATTPESAAAPESTAPSNAPAGQTPTPSASAGAPPSRPSTPPLPASSSR